jgi:N-terminal domain of anti-restriction factor ArdC
MTIATHAIRLLNQMPLKPAQPFGRPPSPTEAIGLELTRLVVAAVTETGVLPWHSDAMRPLPRNAATGNPASGVNTALHLIMHAVRPSLELITGTPKQWQQLGATPHPDAVTIPYVYYRALGPGSGRAVPMRGALIDVTQVEFRDAHAAQDFARTHPRAIDGSASPKPGSTADAIHAAILADPARHERIIARFGDAGAMAMYIIADLAAAYAAAGHAPHASDIDQRAALTFLAERPAHLLWIGAEAQRVVPSAPSRPAAKRSALYPRRDR